MKIILTGPKGAGKTTLGKKIASVLDIPFAETDEIVKAIYAKKYNEKLSCREIWSKHGEEFFRELENHAAQNAAAKDWCLISTGGGTLYNSANRRLLRKNSILVLLKAGDDFLWSRVLQEGLPPFLACDGGFEIFRKRNRKLYEIAEPISDIVFDVDKISGNRAEALADEISAFIMLGMNSPNTFGEIVRVTTFGESHGEAIGAVLDGILPGIPLSQADIQWELDRRRPGQSSVSTQRNEKDAVRILSGVFEGKTTGTPICLIINNDDQKSFHYDALREIFRPGHADFTFWKKYGLRDYRGGGRSSGRETAGRVAAGAVAKKLLSERGISITAFALMIGGVFGETEDLSAIESNPVRAADTQKALEMEESVLAAKREGDSVGGIVKCIIKGCPVGLGDPVFFKLDARLASAFFSVGAVKGFELGAGFEAANMRGSENNDAMAGGNFLSNNAGGILGGISTGEDIVIRAAIKPTPSVTKEQQTCDIHGSDRTIRIEGRHDPCIVPRIIPVLEAMAALVILDSVRMQEKIGENS